MGIDTNYELKKQPFNISWKRFWNDLNVTIPRNRILKKEDKFFAIGSCFANELRTALEMRGFDVYPKCSSEILKDIFPDANQAASAWTTYGGKQGWWDDRAHLQCYNTFSIRQEFEKAYGEWKQSEDDYIAVGAGEGKTQYWDPYRRSIYTYNPEDLKKIIRQHDKVLREGILEADVIVITLGLIEVFKRHLNKKATCQYNRHFVKEVDFEVSSFQDNYDNIKRVCDLIKENHPEKKIILTTSPVALVQTFRNMDVVVANCESKSLLRTVAGQISREYDNVHYYPSYEICMFNKNTFKKDLRHVTEHRVKSIMDTFVQTHIEMNEENDDETRYYD
jgi:hypothetical protein